MIHEKRFRKIYLLPNLITIINISFGYFSVLSIINGKFARAALFIILSAVIDGLDGIIARATKTQSDFGVQLDSFADAFSFGAAPSLLLFFWGFYLTDPRGVGFFFSFMFFIAGILRLARFNILQKTSRDRKYYTGLTVPSAALLIASIVLAHPFPLEGKLYASLLPFLVLTLSFLMIGTLKYRNYLNFNFRQKNDIGTIFIMAICIISLIIFPRIFFLLYASLNVLSGPAAFMVKLVKRQKEKAIIPDNKEA